MGAFKSKKKKSIDISDSKTNKRSKSSEDVPDGKPVSSIPETGGNIMVSSKEVETLTSDF